RHTISTRDWSSDVCSSDLRQIRVDYEPAARTHGQSKWNVSSLLGLSIEGLTSFSVAPLRLASLLGLLMAAAALVFGVQILIETEIGRASCRERELARAGDR